MSSTLQEAIVAARAGDIERAQLITAGVVRDNPDDPNGWYLLSQLVESDARRATYLRKTLALDPDHARARVEFDALPPAVAGELLSAPPVGAAEVVDAEIEPAGAAAAAVVATQLAPEPDGHAESLYPDRPEDLPEWLQPLTSEPVLAEQPAPVAVVATQPRPKPTPRPKQPVPAQKNSGNQALSILLGLLALLTVLVLVFLIYLLFF